MFANGSDKTTVSCMETNLAKVQKIDAKIANNAEFVNDSQQHQLVKLKEQFEIALKGLKLQKLRHTLNNFFKLSPPHQ